MANLTLREAKILPDGRVVRLTFTVVPAPVAHGFANHRTAIIADDTPISMSGGRVPIWSGQFWGLDHDIGFAGMYSQTGSPAVLTPGYYYSRWVYRSGATPVSMTAIAGGWDAGGAPNGTMGELVSSGQRLTCTIPYGGVPVGLVGDLYLSTPDGLVSSCRLWKSGIVAGVESQVIDTAEFEDDQQEFPTMLCWRAQYSLSAAHRVAYGESITITAPAGLLRDDDGNQTAAFTGFACTNKSRVLANGWAKRDYDLGAGKHLYLGGGSANDSNNGTSWAQAKATYSSLDPLIANGDRIHVARGGTYSVSVARLNQKTGIDFDHPIMLYDDWNVSDGADPGTRPIFRNTAANPILRRSASNGDQPISNFVMLGIHLQDNELLSTLTSGMALSPNSRPGWEHNFLQDVKFENFGTAMECGGMDTALSRCIVDGSYSKGTSTHSQGLHTGSGFDMQFSETLFNNCGYKNKDVDGWGIDPTQFNHAHYGNFPNRQVCCTRVFIYHCSLTGMMLRGGGTIDTSVILDVGLGFSIYGVGGSVFKTVIGETHTLPQGGSRIIGTASVGVPCELNATFDENLFYDAGTLFSFTIYTGSSDAPGGHSNKMGFVGHRNNTAIECERVRYTTYPTIHLFENTIHECLAVGSKILVQSLTSTAYVSGAFRASSDRNVLRSTVASWFQSGISGTPSGGIAQLRSWTGGDANTLTDETSFINSSYRSTELAASLGFGSTRDLVEAWRDRLPGVWDDAISTEAMIDLYRENLTPTNRVGFSADPWAYAGWVDFRPDSPIIYTITGPSNATVGVPIALTVTPSAESDETLDVSIVGEDSEGNPADGDVSPSQIMFGTGIEALPLEATANDAGSFTVTVSLSGVPVADFTFIGTDPDPPDPPAGQYRIAFTMTGVLLLSPLEEE